MLQGSKTGHLATIVTTPPMLEPARKSNGFWREKLAVDFVAEQALRGYMDEDKRDLILQLATQAGMLMEDASVVALTMVSLGDAEIKQALERMEVFPVSAYGTD